MRGNDVWGDILCARVSFGCVVGCMRLRVLEGMVGGDGSVFCGRLGSVWSLICDVIIGFHAPRHYDCNFHS